MTDQSSVPSISMDERLARFVLFSRWIRRSGNTETVKADAFIPHPYPNLSVTRHLLLSEQALWRIGNEVAKVRSATLYGSADITVADATNNKLQVAPAPAPVPGNPNHANVIGWPLDKPAQKIIALELAAAAIFVSQPN